MIQPPDDLFEQVFHAIEGEEVEQQVWHYSDGSQKTVERRYFGPEKWIRRVHRRGILTPLQFLAIVHYVLVDFDDRDQDERRIVDGWYRAVLDAAERRVIVPRDRDSLLPLESFDSWNNWVLSVADADSFVASAGMEWTCTEIAGHLFDESYPGEVPADDLRQKQEAAPPEPESADDSNANGGVLTHEQRTEVKRRLRDGEKVTALARDYKVSHQAISKIKRSSDDPSIERVLGKWGNRP
jgi:hypothetical protein